MCAEFGGVCIVQYVSVTLFTSRCVCIGILLLLEQQISTGRNYAYDCVSCIRS